MEIIKRSKKSDPEHSKEDSGGSRRVKYNKGSRGDKNPRAERRSSNIDKTLVR